MLASLQRFRASLDSQCVRGEGGYRAEQRPDDAAMQRRGAVAVTAEASLAGASLGAGASVDAAIGTRGSRGDELPSVGCEMRGATTPGATTPRAAAPQSAVAMLGAEPAMGFEADARPNSAHHSALPSSAAPRALLDEATGTVELLRVLATPRAKSTSRSRRLDHCPLAPSAPRHRLAVAALRLLSPACAPPSLPSRTSALRWQLPRRTSLPTLPAQAHFPPHVAELFAADSGELREMALDRLERLLQAAAGSEEAEDAVTPLYSAAERAEAEAEAAASRAEVVAAGEQAASALPRFWSRAAPLRPDELAEFELPLVGQEEERPVAPGVGLGMGVDSARGRGRRGVKRRAGGAAAGGAAAGRMLHGARRPHG